MRVSPMLVGILLLAGCSTAPTPFQVQGAPHHNAGASNNVSNDSSYYISQINANDQNAWVDQKQKAVFGGSQNAYVGQKSKQSNDYYAWTNQKNKGVYQKAKASVYDLSSGY